MVVAFANQLCRIRHSWFCAESLVMPSRRGRGCRLFCCDAFSCGERLGITWLSWSEVLEELEELVGGAVPAGSGAGRGGAVERSLFESEVAVEVAAGGVFLFVSEPQRDHAGADVGLQERHRVRVPQDVGGDSLGVQRWAVGGGGRGVFVDQPFDGVAAERPAAVGREQRIFRLAAAFFEPARERFDGLGGEWDDPLFASFALAEQVRAGTESDVLAGQAGEFGDAQSGLDRGQEQRVVSPAGPGVWVRGGEQRFGFFFGEVVDQRVVESFGRDREHPFDHGGVFGVAERGVSVERVDPARRALRVRAPLPRSCSRCMRNWVISSASRSSSSSLDGGFPSFALAKLSSSRIVSR